MSILSSLFGKGPFKPLVEHANKVKEVLDIFKPMIAAFLDGDHATLRKLHNDVSRLEHEADEVRNNVRGALTKAMFLPVNRSDILAFLHQQDDIADSVEDVSVMFTLKTVRLHDELKPLFSEFVNKTFEAASCILEGSIGMDDLLEASFDGPEADSIINIAEKVGQLEWETDRIQRRFLRKLFELENEVSPVDIIYLMRLAQQIGEIADHAENTANFLAMMIAGN